MWLYRALEVKNDEGLFSVEYIGYEFGKEYVKVNGEVVASGKSLLWFIPLFEFSIGSRQACINVRVWPWLRIKSFRFEIEGIGKYSE
jgi:hypothetical protein